MIVPFTRGQDQAQPKQAQPSETDMLMALATMHSMGRFAQNDVRPGSEDNNPIANSAAEIEAGVRKNKDVRVDPSYGPVKDLLKNLPSDIERLDDGGGTRLRLKKEVPTS